MKQLRRPQKTRQQKRRFRRRLWTALISLVIILGSFFYIINHEVLAVKEVRLAGQKTIIDEEIISLIESYKQEHYLGLIRKDNILVMSTGDITRRLKEAFPTIEKISVSLENRDRLLVTIGERTAEALWCIDQDYELAFEEECYFSDASGLLYARAPYFSGNIYLKLFIPKPDGEIVGTFVDAVPSLPLFFSMVNNMQEHNNLQISRVVFHSNQDAELSLARLGDTLYRQDQPVILMNLAEEYETILRNLDITLSYDTFRRDFQAKPSDLESIDIRFEGRVFYRFKNHSPTQ